jgi:hypothetical protein
LGTKKIKEFVSTRKQAGRKTLSKKCIKFSTAKNGKRQTDTQDLTQCLILILLTNQKDDDLFKKDDRLFLKRGRVLVQT